MDTPQGAERLNSWSIREYLRNIVMLGIKLPMWAAQLLLFWVPLKKNRVVVYSLKQHGYSCNLKYLTEYLKTHHPDTFEILWVVKSEKDLEQLRSRGIPAVMAASFAHFRYRHRAATVITNDEFYPACRKRRGQRYINTWHGGINYKKIGYEGLIFTNPLQETIYRMNNPCPEVFVSGSGSFTDTASNSFGFPREVFLECGLPRNDILVAGVPEESIAALRRNLGIPEGNRVLLYAPTFRKGNHPPQLPDMAALRQALSRRFGGEWTVLLRMHYFVSGREATPSVLDVSEYEDIQELMLLSDCLISDYSSCMWDFLLTDKPCFVYAPDAVAYLQEDRSFFIPMEQWPYPLAGDEDTLHRNIADFSPEEFRRRVTEHRRQCRSFDRGTACRTLADYLIQGERI